MDIVRYDIPYPAIASPPVASHPDQYSLYAESASIRKSAWLEYGYFLKTCVSYQHLRHVAVI